MTRRTICSLLTVGAMDRLLAEDFPWEESTHAGSTALEQGFQRDAEQNFRLALNQAKNANADDLVIASCLDNLARATELVGGAREKLYRESLGIRERRLKPSDPEIARSLVHVASTAYSPETHKAKDPRETEQMLDRALKIAENEPQSVLMAEVSEALGLFRHCGFAAENNYTELPGKVEPLYRRALEIREKNSRSGETDLALAQILELNYVLLRETGRADQAEPLFARATEVRAKHIQDLSPTEPGGAHRIGPGIYPPSVVSKQEPEYSDLARLLKW